MHSSNYPLLYTNRCIDTELRNFYYTKIPTHTHTHIYIYINHRTII